MHFTSILLAIGAAIGLAWSAWLTIAANDRAATLDAGLSALAGALLGGRLAYVAVNGFYFADHLAEIPQVWLGGCSAPGALAGALVGLSLFAAWRRLPAARLADALLPLLWMLSIAAWLTAWLDGVAYGRPLAAGWALPARDEWGTVSSRWPVQAAGILATAAIAAALSLGRKGLRQPGLPASLGLLGVSLQLLAAAFLRSDPMPAWLGLRLDAWGAIPLTVAAAMAVLILASRQRRQAVGVSPAGRGNHASTSST